MLSRVLLCLLAVLVLTGGLWKRRERKSYYLAQCRLSDLEACYKYCVEGSLRGTWEVCESAVETEVGADL